MSSSVDDRVLEFYDGLFERLFSQPFRASISEQRRLRKVIRQVEEAAEAASSSLTRFFLNQKLSEQTTAEMLAGFEEMGSLLQLPDISNSNVTTEKIVEDLLSRLPYPQGVQHGHEAVYRLGLYTVVQVLMQVGPVMAEWQKLNFSTTFELPRRVVNRLNEISDQINAQGVSGQAGADESYELQYRDYLLQRFHRVEADTVRMTTSLDVDLRELFVMPRVVVRKLYPEAKSAEGEVVDTLMDLAKARRRYRKIWIAVREDNKKADEQSPTAFEQVKHSYRTVIVGLPGVGKSTFLEWLQVKLASVEETLILGDQQAIPLLLRVRQLDLLNLPKGADIIERATASKDRADLMPQGWLDRQMKAGRVLFMLDGLDETEPEKLNEYLIPWLFDLLEQYPNCHYLISSRPVGYSAGLLAKQKFVECDLLDFNELQIREYACHWCTAVRLARNESEAEARREGERDGSTIVDSFQDHPYIRDLARNPLMLSAICLVHYFEGGELPKDRALLYQLCVEGLLHHWDKRRGIHSEFSLDEKLRTCREVALGMQLEDRAEWDADKVQTTFAGVLGGPERATKLLEHIRYRTGLLLERRPNVFGFAHLTFQEYLAAQAIHESNQVCIDANLLVKEHDDGRWKEVIALYSGLATTPAVKDLIEKLIAQLDTEFLAEVLTETYFSAGSKLEQERELRQRVLERVAISPSSIPAERLNRFPMEEVVPIANALVGTIQSRITLSESFVWLDKHPAFIEIEALSNRLQALHSMTPVQVDEIVYLLHKFAADEKLVEIASIPNLYTYAGATYEIDRTYLFLDPNYEVGETYSFQAEIALIGLAERNVSILDLQGEGFMATFRQIIPMLLKSRSFGRWTLRCMRIFLRNDNREIIIPVSTWSIAIIKELKSLIRQLVNHLEVLKTSEAITKYPIDATLRMHTRRRFYSAATYMNELAKFLEDINT